MFELTANMKQTSITYKSWIRMENGIVVNEYAPQTEFHLAAHKYSATPASQEGHHQAFSVVLDFCLLSLFFRACIGMCTLSRCIERRCALSKNPCE